MRFITVVVIVMVFALGLGIPGGYAAQVSMQEQVSTQDGDVQSHKSDIPIVPLILLVVLGVVLGAVSYDLVFRHNIFRFKTASARPFVQRLVYQMGEPDSWKYDGYTVMHTESGYGFWLANGIAFLNVMDARLQETPLTFKERAILIPHIRKLLQDKYTLDGAALDRIFKKQA